MSELKFPTEMVDLPSKGLFYPESHPLASLPPVPGGDKSKSQIAQTPII